MNNIHKYLLQFVMQKGTVSLEDTLQFCNRIDSGIESTVDIKRLVSTINGEISKHFLSIALTTCEITMKPVLVFANRKDDHISHLTTQFSSAEVNYFFELMSHIMSTDKYTMQYNWCINMSSDLKDKLSFEHAQTVLNKWIKSGYFVLSDNNVNFGPRCIVEFDTFFKSNLENSLCALCNELVVKNITCDQCDNIFHKFCVQKYLQSHKKCPSCSKEWNADDIVE